MAKGHFFLSIKGRTVFVEPKQGILDKLEIPGRSRNIEMCWPLESYEQVLVYLGSSLLFLYFFSLFYFFLYFSPTLKDLLSGLSPYDNRTMICKSNRSPNHNWEISLGKKAIFLPPPSKVQTS